MTKINLFLLIPFFAFTYVVNAQNEKKTWGLNRAIQDGNISVSGENAPEESIEMCFDGSPETKWLTFSTNAWIQYKFADDKAYVISRYAITSANDFSERDPKDWVLKGSNDGKNFTILDTKTDQNFADRFTRNVYALNNSKAYKYYQLDIITNHGSNEIQMADFELIDLNAEAVSERTDIVLSPTWQEHWFEHNQLLTLVKYNQDLALYFDKDMNLQYAGWIAPLMTKVWQYTKSVYGNFGPDGHLYAIYHQDKYSGGHPATYLDESHENRNTIDCGPGSWSSATGWAIDAPIHEIGHIVEGASQGVKGSPAFNIWGDSKWCEIYLYDVYMGIGANSDAIRVYNSFINTSDNFPKSKTYWFRDWFLPIYKTYGGNKVLSGYFKVLAKNYVKEDNVYSKEMNWGEFVHFWSGAAGVNLKELAKKAFGWSNEWEKQFQQARKDYPGVKYKD